MPLGPPAAKSEHAIFERASPGINAHRGKLVYSYNQVPPVAGAERFSRRVALFRPFTRKYLYHDPSFNDRGGLLRRIFPSEATESENAAIILPASSSGKATVVLASRMVSDVQVAGAGVRTLVYPRYTYDPDGSNRRDNVTDRAVETFQRRYNDPTIDHWDVFHYVYGFLHDPTPVPRSLNRVGFAPDFRALMNAGKGLAHLHIHYEDFDPYLLTFVEASGQPLSYHVEDRMRLSGDRTRLAINPSLTLAGIPPRAFEYRLDSRSALEWVIDQYQVRTDPRTGNASDPNRPDDPQYIVRLVGQVISISLQSLDIIQSVSSATRSP